jgi:hypothetical protein
LVDEVVRNWDVDDNDKRSSTEVVKRAEKKGMK